MRNYTYFDKYLTELEDDAYSTNADDAHKDWAHNVIYSMMPKVDTVLDVGCGTGFCSTYFEDLDVEYTGITLGTDDYAVALSNNVPVIFGDMSFLDFDDKSFDLIFSRHSLEHSPFPLLTLMEWYRVSKRYLLLVLPSPDFWTWGGRQHYSVLTDKQWWWLLKRAGWKFLSKYNFTTDEDLFMKYYGDGKKKIQFPRPTEIVEYRYLLEKE